MPDLETRIERLEREFSAMKRLFQTAVGFDPNIAEDSKIVGELISEEPGLSQTGVTVVARNRAGLSRQRVIEVLRAGVGRLWRVEAGLFNALLYYPIANGTQAHIEISATQQVGLETTAHNSGELSQVGKP